MDSRDNFFSGDSAIYYLEVFVRDGLTLWPYTLWKINYKEDKNYSAFIISKNHFL